MYIECIAFDLHSELLKNRIKTNGPEFGFSFAGHIYQQSFTGGFEMRRDS